MKHATQIAATLTTISWVVLAVGLSAVAWTFAENFDDLSGVAGTQVAVGLGVPVITCWGVLRGLAEVLNLGTLLVALVDETNPPS